MERLDQESDRWYDELSRLTNSVKAVPQRRSVQENSAMLSILISNFLWKLRSLLRLGKSR